MLNILIVDDDEDTRLLLHHMLTWLGHQSFEADSGVEGESLALQKEPDAILLDLMMADQNGFETCARLRNQGYQGVIIIVSAMPYSQRDKARAKGANAYIQKPVTPRILQLHLDHFSAL